MSYVLLKLLEKTEVVHHVEMVDKVTRADGMVHEVYIYVFDAKMDSSLG